MSSTFWTSDTHFGHANIIKYCDRPFSSVEEMDENLITNWNSVVKKSDIIYHLGDFTFYKDPKKIDNILKRLNGRKILIRGNHDQQLKDDLLKHFEEIHQLHEIQINDSMNNKRVVMCHYPLREWNLFHRGSFMLYGHVHGKLNENKDLMCDVGVDSWNYFPASWEDIKLHMKSKDNNLNLDLI